MGVGVYLHGRIPDFSGLANWFRCKTRAKSACAFSFRAGPGWLGRVHRTRGFALSKPLAP